MTTTPIGGGTVPTQLMKRMSGGTVPTHQSPTSTTSTPSFPGRGQGRLPRRLCSGLRSIERRYFGRPRLGAHSHASTTCQSSNYLRQFPSPSCDALLCLTLAPLITSVNLNTRRRRLLNSSDAIFFLVSTHDPPGILHDRATHRNNPDDTRR